MKKIVCALFALVMMLSLLTPAFAAEAQYDDETGITTKLIFDCDEKPKGSNSLALDTTEKTQGNASLTFNVGSGSVNEMKLPEEVDCTDLDTLEFDLYVSDAKLFDLFGVQGKMDSGLEITSSGKSDNQEISWTLAQIKANNQGEEIKAGWNHIILALNAGRSDVGTDEQLKGAFDVSCVNFMRFYMVGETLSYDITVKIDNVCLSDWTAVTAAAKREAQAKKKAEEFTADVTALADVTAENYATIKSDVEALRKTYDKLNDIAKEYVTKAALDKLVAAEAKIAEFEANPPSADTGNDNTGNENIGNDATTGETPASGCGAVAMLGGVAILALAGAMLLRKKED